MLTNGLVGKSKEELIKELTEIKKQSQKEDEIKIKEGYTLKYVVDILNKKDEIEEIKCFYSKIYFKSDEMADSVLDSKIKKICRGPYPLTDSVFVDSKLERWEYERNESIKNNVMVSKNIDEAKSKGYKLAYIVYDIILSVDKFIELRFLNEKLSQSQLKNILSSSKYDYQRKIDIVDLSNNRKEEITNENFMSF